MNKSIKLFIVTSFLLINACSTTFNNSIKDEMKVKQHIINVSKNNGADFSIKIIKSINNYQTKASTDYQQAYTKNQIKSYKVWICTQQQAPLTSKLTDSIFTFDSDISTTSEIVRFVNVPPTPEEKNYYAVVSAYDKTVAEELGKNITKEKDYETDGKQQLAVSSNSIIVKNDLTVEPVDQILSVSLPLMDSVNLSIETNITPADGSNGFFGNQ